MQGKAFVLVYGRKASLNEVRSMMLERAGFRVRAVTALAEVGAIAAAQRVDLLLLCHTLSAGACDRAIARIRSADRGVEPTAERSAQFKYLRLTEESDLFAPEALEEFLAAYQAHAGLTAAVMDLLGRYGPAAN